ncbi:MAG: hypothetical protein ACN4E2_03525 [Nitrospinota bacterium]
MSFAGILTMLTSMIAIISLNLFCFGKILKLNNQQMKRIKSLEEIETKDHDSTAG